MKKVLTIEGMTCKHCSGRVENALEDIEGVKSVKVRLRRNTATVKLDTLVEDSILKEAVEDAGYNVTDIK